jgi:hypothetical protein
MSRDVDIFSAIFHVNYWHYFNSKTPARWLSRSLKGAKPAPPGQTAAPEPYLYGLSPKSPGANIKEFLPAILSETERPQI